MRPSVSVIPAQNAPAFGAKLLRVARQPAVPFIAIASLFAGIIVGLFVATPTLNLDDLGYAANWEMPFSDPRFFATLKQLFLNADLATTQVRTYGLERAIHLLGMSAFGATPVATYAFIAFVHFASAGAIYAFMREVADDHVTALFAAVVWAASPAALPMFKSEHHFLYSLADFYPLLLWVVLASKPRSGWLWHIGGTLLLASACLLGEAVIIPIGAAVVLMACVRRQSIWDRLGRDLAECWPHLVSRS